MQRRDIRGLKLTDWFDYQNGQLIWKKTNRKGKVVGSLHPTGYLQCQWRGCLWQVHRLVWAWHGNELTDGMEIDHINRDRTDNRIENLRQVTRSENNANRKAVHVNYCKGKWKAYTSRCGNNGKQIHLGSFNTKQEALQAARQHSVSPLLNSPIS